MKIKILEIRDRATFIPAFAFKVDRGEEYDPRVREMLGRAGWHTGSGVYLGRLERGECHYSPYDWGSPMVRTMPQAHQYLIDHWDEIPDGGLIDVCAIVGEESLGTDLSYE